MCIRDSYYLGKEYVRKESPYYNETKGIQYLERAKEQGNDRAKDVYKRQICS